jgi:flagellin-like hook-associated protein FlgL
MPFSVSLSQGVLSNLLALQQTTNQINTIQNQLATGKKVNSALDNPTNFFLANSLQNSVNTLSTLLDGINIGQRTLDAANNGITSLTNLLNSAKGTLNQALASASTTSVLTGTATGLTSTTTLASLGFAATDVITVNDGTTNTTTFTAAANTTVQGLLNFINQGGNTGNNKDRAEISGDGRVLIEGATAAASVTITTNSASTTAVQNLGFNATATNGTINNTAAAGALNASRSAFAAQFDALRAQIDQQAADSGYNGTSLLNSQSLTVALNQSGTAKLVLTGNTDTSAGLGVVASQNTFQDNFDINTALTNVNNALNTLQNQASTAASQVSVIQSRKDFTNNTIATLSNGINDLTLADSNQVGAQLLALQTRQTLSSTALSLATQSDQNVLRLFR